MLFFIFYLFSFVLTTCLPDEETFIPRLFLFVKVFSSNIIGVKYLLQSLSLRFPEQVSGFVDVPSRLPFGPKKEIFRLEKEVRYLYPETCLNSRVLYMIK